VIGKTGSFALLFCISISYILVLAMYIVGLHNTHT